MKNQLKVLVRAGFALLGFPAACLYWLLAMMFNKDSLFAGFSQFFSLFPGKTGSYIRVGFYRWTMAQCDPDLFLGFGVLFSQQDTSLEAGTYIGPQCNIGRCHIKANTLLGSGVHIMSGKGQHNFTDLSQPIREQGGEYQKIQIGEDCWIGNGALVMANLGRGCIVGAGSVVIHDMPDYAILAGNPAKIIKSRQP